MIIKVKMLKKMTKAGQNKPREIRRRWHMTKRNNLVIKQCLQREVV